MGNRNIQPVLDSRCAADAREGLERRSRIRKADRFPDTNPAARARSGGLLLVRTATVRPGRPSLAPRHTGRVPGSQDQAQLILAARRRRRGFRVARSRLRMAGQRVRPCSIRDLTFRRDTGPRLPVRQGRCGIDGRSCFRSRHAAKNCRRFCTARRTADAACAVVLRDAGPRVLRDHGARRETRRRDGFLRQNMETGCPRDTERNFCSSPSAATPC